LSSDINIINARGMSMSENELTKGEINMKDLLLPKNDLVFQTLFTRGKESIIKSLIENILKIKINKIDLDRSKDLLNDNTKDKNGRLDLRAIIDDNIECNIEVQLATHKKMLERFLYYWAKIYTANLETGEEYEKLRKTISIIIVDDNIEQFREIKQACTKWRILEEKYKKVCLTDYFQLAIIELPKAVEEYKSNKEDGMLQWMMFLENPEDAEVGKIMKENEDIKEAKNELERISQDEILRRQLLKAKIARMDAIQREKDARDDGKEEKAIEIAKNLLKKNIPIEIIIDATGLTKEEIKKIKNKE
jgi:predicted transposase/invertase (TIGR01784 family)